MPRGSPGVLGGAPLQHESPAPATSSSNQTTHTQTIDEIDLYGGDGAREGLEMGTRLRSRQHRWSHESLGGAGHYRAPMCSQAMGREQGVEDI
jgi:hypothetical protein